MENKYILSDTTDGLSDKTIKEKLFEYFDKVVAERILIIPPDITRINSYAGKITNILYHRYKNKKIDIMPALGTHAAMSREDIFRMFGDIPYENFIVHNWREDTISIGVIPKNYVYEWSEGKFNEDIQVDVNKRLIVGKYDLIISIGQVVPHEIVGFAGYTKNIMVGCGGKKIIDYSHYIGAVFGMERILGRINTPVRKLYNFAANNFLRDTPIIHILTVTSILNNKLNVHAISIGKGDELFENTAKISFNKNITLIEKPVKNVIAYLDPEEFKTTWLANKAIYRSRMAIESGGKLIIIAPGLERFGEDLEIDKIIRKYGYVGTNKILELVSSENILKNNLSVAAHLIHGSSEGRFDIYYAPGKLSKEEVEKVNYKYITLNEAMRKYNIEKLSEGYNDVKGEDIYFIRYPALGLWSSKDAFS